MFVAVACDFGGDDHKGKVYSALLEYGFKKVHEGLFESFSINDASLLRLKRELDSLTDSYDSLHFYQYPMEDTLVISVLKEKKWRKTVVTTGKRERP